MNDVSLLDFSGRDKFLTLLLDRFTTLYGSDTKQQTLFPQRV